MLQSRTSVIIKWAVLIYYKVRLALLQSGAAFLYYKAEQIILQSRISITKQGGAGIAKWGNYYKVGKNRAIFALLVSLTTSHSCFLY